MSRIVYVNGKYVPEEQGNVSIFDRGFLFADGVYEVTAIVHGKLIDYDPHMERLARSLAEISMAWPCSKADVRRMQRGKDVPCRGATFSPSIPPPNSSRA